MGRCGGDRYSVEAVEGEARALAKLSRWIDGDERFFEEFYGRFFASEVARRENSEGKFQDRVQQRDKLRKGMAAVLNFYPGERADLAEVRDRRSSKQRRDG